MIGEPSCHRAGPVQARGPTHRGAFTLVELLTVVFIISLLIGILIPSINAARTAAKRLTTAKALAAIDVGLEMFRNDNETDFRQTNGYPPSFSHPPLKGYTFQPHLGQFPFLDSSNGGSDGSPPVVYGAHWLPAMLMGADGLGYVKRSTVPRDLQDKPFCWYPNPVISLRQCNNDRPPSMPFYLDPGNTRTLTTERLPGNPPVTGATLFPNWEDMKTLPVIVDAFDQPVLYYASNTYGRDTNMLEDFRDQNNSYTGGTQQEGPPYYFHQDNDGFTGTKAIEGWNFGGSVRRSTPALSTDVHPIAMSGADIIPDNLKNDPDAFANYILDRQVARGLEASGNAAALLTLRPVKIDTYLLITAGPDGRFGTKDDVTNLPKKSE